VNFISQGITDRAEFEFQLFGQPEFRLHGTELNLSVRKVLALLAYLTIEGSGSRSVLAGLLWTELDEASARRNLRQRLYRLSPPELAACVLVEANRVSLTGFVTSDVASFDLAMLESRFADAVGLYRGLLLDGLELEEASAFHEWLDVKREFFERGFQRALAGFADQLEEAGSTRDALVQHQRLIEVNPLLELHQRHVMRLRAGLGERAEALAGFEDFRVLLEIELGLLPTPETVSLAAQIREQGVLEEHAPDQTTIQMLPLATTPLIGRKTVLDQLELAWNAGKMIFVTGEPGVGKSRLLTEFAQHKTAQIMHGRAGDATIPFATLTRVIRKLLQASPNLVLPRWVRQELSRLVPSLDEAPTPGGAEARIRLFDAFAEFFWLTTAHLDTYIIDDLQFFDSDSFEMILHAFSSLDRPAGKHQILAYRTGELSALMTASLEQVFKAGNTLQIQLEPLSESSVCDLVETVFGSQEPVLFSRRLHRATGGNPFFALETLKSLVESNALQQDEYGDWGTSFDDTTTSYAELPMPESVVAAVRERVARLGVQATRLLETASLAGDAFTLEDLLFATTLTEFEALEAFERALELSLLERQAQSYRFTHDLVRESLALGLGAERKRLLHRKLAENLEKHGGAATRIALHLEQAGQKQAAVPWRVKAAEAALLVYANREATLEFEKALEDNTDPSLERAGVLDALVVLLWRQSLFEKAMNCALEVARIRGSLGDQVGLARADIRIGVLQMALGKRDLALVSLEGALARARNENAIPEQCSALINLIKFHTDVGDVQSAKPMIEAGLMLSDALPKDDNALFETARTYCALLEGDLGLAVQFSAIAIESAQVSQDAFAHCSALFLAVEVHLGLGSVQTVDALLEAANSLTEQHDFGLHRVAFCIKSAWLALTRGNPQLALEGSLALMENIAIQSEDQAFVAWIISKSYLSLQDSHKALETLNGFEDAPTLEIWTRILTVRLQSALELGIKLDSYIQAAKTQLESDRTPALERLELRQALARALEATGDLESASREHNLANIHLLEMSATLENHPELQASFLEKYKETT
jgi:DNA-binding SARP family transcriptional activator/tetratricopeptide (TPR) repeat protein/energy-coupling factor transporter ATP-binding protein EcfA2